MSTPDHQQLSMGQLMFAGGFSAIPATVRCLVSAHSSSVLNQRATYLIEVVVPLC